LGFSAILRKDLRLELRAGESILSLVGLALLILVVIVFASDPSASRQSEAAAGALWVALIFAGTMGAARAMSAERNNGCLSAILLSPADRAAIFAAKLAAAFIFMAIAEVAAVFILVLFFNLDFDARLLRLAPSLMLGALGFAAIATMITAMTDRLHAGDLLLPMIAIPLFVPALISGVRSGALALAGAPLGATMPWLKLLVAFDLIFLSAGYLLFEYVVGED
jgi:heme exporter protein B